MRNITGTHTTINETIVGAIRHTTTTHEIGIRSLRKLITSPEHLDVPTDVDLRFRPASESKPYGAGTFLWKTHTLEILTGK